MQAVKTSCSGPNSKHNHTEVTPLLKQFKHKTNLCFHLNKIRNTNNRSFARRLEDDAH